MLKTDPDHKPSDHSFRSSYRERLFEHLFVGELMKYFWLFGFNRLEVSIPQVDDGGYDLVLEGNDVVRHVQLKTTFSGSKVNRFNIHTRLSLKPSACMVVILFDKNTLDLGSFLWLGAAPGQKLPNLKKYPIAKHAKGNAQGVKLEKPQHRYVPRAAFKRVNSIPELAMKLFGHMRRDEGRASLNT
jgi:hypothetical protein